MVKRNRNSELVKRFSKKQAERAAQISNDIAEGVRRVHSIKDIEMAVAYYADVACVEAQKRARLESKLALYVSAKALMDLALRK
jgi:hypothetical protein